MAVLVLAAVVGVIASLAAWCFLELIFYMQQWVFTDIPKDLGFDQGPPLWWYLPVLAFAGLVTAFAIARLPGSGGHVPAEGLNASPTQPIDLPGVLLAALASIGLGLVVGPEAPLIALGGGLGFLTVRSIRRDAPPQLGTLLASSGTFAAMSFLFGSPIIAAVILIEAAGLGGSRMPLVLIPGLLAAGIGSLVSIGMGSLTGLSTSDISLSPLNLPAFARPDLVDFLWTIPFAAVIAVVTFLIFRLAREAQRIATPRPFVFLPAAGLLVAGLAIAFTKSTDHGVNQVLFSGQSAHRPIGREPRRLVAVGARAADRLQGPRLRRLPRHLPRRPDLPGDVPRRGRWPDGGPAARIRADARGRGGPGRRGRRRAEIAAGSGRAGHSLHRACRSGLGTPDHRGGGGRLSDRAGSRWARELRGIAEPDGTDAAGRPEPVAMASG